SLGFKTIEMTVDDSDKKSEVTNGNKTPVLLKEAEQIVHQMQSNNIHAIVVDSYNVSPEYFKRIEPNARTAYIDDINSFSYPVDIIINGNINAAELNYIKYSKAQQMLIGIEYNMIRKEFQNLPKRTVSKEISRIMLTTGGSDPFRLSCRLTGCILKNLSFKNYQLNVIIGAAFTNKSELYELAGIHKNLILHENPSRMSEIMMESDMAISSGGSTLYELCACGTPTLAFIKADKQTGILKKKDELGLVQSIGRHNEVTESGFTKALLDLELDYTKRQKMSGNGQKLADGNGCRRIASRLLEMIK
ncbi:MAG: UDP-2,4-diacetamido-2,4,6-trideoxy-beta-L-altropyranose hydrolase, partial [Ruminiclostridium sp.]|nr:UDP-2,4-diacetamido-2,4,6-trideoxy-beta-L-altropyranose hydrolase [Ruminiclostridium sp.]